MHKLFNMRYRFYTVNGKHYLVDMDERYWVMFFPLIYWFLPHTVYEVDEVTFDKLKFDPDEQKEKPGENVNYFAVGGASLLFANLFGYVSHYFEMNTTNLTNIIIATIVGLIIIFARVYMSVKSKQKMEEHLSLVKLRKQSLYIIPTSFKHILFTLTAFVFFLVGAAYGCFAFIQDKNTVFLFFDTVFIFIYLILGAFMITLEQFKVKFRN